METPSELPYLDQAVFEAFAAVGKPVSQIASNVGNRAAFLASFNRTNETKYFPLEYGIQQIDSLRRLAHLAIYDDSTLIYKTMEIVSISVAQLPAPIESSIRAVFRAGFQSVPSIVSDPFSFTAFLSEVRYSSTNTVQNRSDQLFTDEQIIRRFLQLGILGDL